MDYNISYTAKKALSKQQIKLFYKTVKYNTPENILGSRQVYHPDNHLENTVLIHRKENDKHIYEIPLTRSLTKSELNVLSTICNQKGFKDIKTTSIDVHDLSKAEEKNIDDTRYKDMATEVAKILHNRWVDKKVASGWRYGMKVSQKDKTHPLLRPWEELNDNQKDIDYNLPKELIGTLKKYF